MRSLCVLVLLGVFVLTTLVGCAPVPGGPALSSATTSSQVGLVASPGTTVGTLPSTTAAPIQIAPLVTSAAE